MCVEIVIAKYTPIFSVLAGAVVVLEAVLGVPGISKRVEEVAAEWVPLWLRILLRVRFLGGGEVSIRGMVRV